MRARIRGDKQALLFDKLDTSDEAFLLNKLDQAIKSKQGVRQYKALIQGKDEKGNRIYFPDYKKGSDEYEKVFLEIRKFKQQKVTILT